MSDVAPAYAKIETVDDPRLSVTCYLNPASVKLSYANKTQGDDAGKSKTQQAPQASTAKLDTEFTIDTTELGADVRVFANDLIAMTASNAVKDKERVRPPRQVTFTWGSFTFTGIIESLTHTYDFWSYEGVPLRATVQLSMTSLDGVGFDLGQAVKTVTLATVSAPPNGKSATDAAMLAGDVNAARMIASINGMESMRLGGGGAAGATLAVGAGVQLKAAAGFSLSAGIGISAGAGLGFGIGASGGAGAGAGIGAGVGISAGVGFSAGASASAGFGASASAGVSAGAGAFAGLGASKSASLSARIDPARLLPPAPAPVGAGASFDVTGRMVSAGNGLAAASVRIG